MVRMLNILFVALATTLPAFGEENILFIGNSYTQGIKQTVTELFKREGVHVHFDFIAPGGKNLTQHLNNPAILDKLRSKDWSFIILQDQSQTPALPGKYTKSFHMAVKGFSQFFSDLKPQPKMCLYMTWGRRDGDARNPNSFPDFPTMQKKLAENYEQAARDNAALIAPVGLAFRAVYDLDENLFRSLYAKDGSHPSKRGAYLAACVFMQVLADRDPTTIRWNNSLESRTANQLKLAAKQAVNE
ncbi:MAG: DUF4886 domain-containing protein [Verrucomicrobiota bacterium]